MKLCVLTKRIQEEPLYQRDGAFLYNLSLDEYKKCILKGIVSTDINHNAIICYRYAEESLCRFEHGEVYISKSAKYSMLYASRIIRGKFIQGEYAFSSNGYYSYRYAKDVLKRRFKLGETAIKRSGYKEDYETRFNITL